MAAEVGKDAAAEVEQDDMTVEVVQDVATEVGKDATAEVDAVEDESAGPRMTLVTGPASRVVNFSIFLEFSNSFSKAKNKTRKKIRSPSRSSDAPPGGQKYMIRSAEKGYGHFPNFRERHDRFFSTVS